MSALARTLFVCLLVLALPAQGIAAATMAFCGPGHPPQASLVDAAEQDHHGAHDHHGAAPGAEMADHTQPGDMAQHGTVKCSACAACCVAVALPAAPLTMPVVEPALERASMAPAAYTGPVGAGLERPPKHLLA